MPLTHKGHFCEWSTCAGLLLATTSKWFPGSTPLTGMYVLKNLQYTCCFLYFADLSDWLVFSLGETSSSEDMWIWVCFQPRRHQLAAQDNHSESFSGWYIAIKKTKTFFFSNSLLVKCMRARTNSQLVSGSEFFQTHSAGLLQGQKKCVTG